MAGFAVMGAVDVVGVVKNYIQDQFMLSDGIAGFIPSACYLWFLLLSVPFARAASTFGRRRVSMAGFLLSFVSLSIPVMLKGSLCATLASMAFLGIGTTAVMVAFNPFVQDVVGPDRLSRTMLFGQGTKSLTAIAIPMLLPLFALTASGWQGALAVLGLTGLLGAFCLHTMKVEEAPSASVGLRSAVHLLCRKKMLLCFLAGALIVAADVCVMACAPRIMQTRTGLDLNQSTFLTVAYPLAKTAVAFLGGALLGRIGENRFLAGSIVLALSGIALLAFASSRVLIIGSLVLFAAGYTNLFSIVFSKALRAFPDRSDAVSSLMIMSLCGGGAVLPLINLF